MMPINKKNKNILINLKVVLFAQRDGEEKRYKNL